MNKKDLINKYLDGDTSIREEQSLFVSEDRESETGLWAEYVSKKSKNAPEGLEEAIWQNITQQKKQKHRLLYGLIATAASVILVLGFWIIKPQESEEMSLSEKQQMLEDALSMFPEEENDKEILYSDELIEIYVATN